MKNNEADNFEEARKHAQATADTTLSLLKVLASVVYMCSPAFRDKRESLIKYRKAYLEANKP
jgi:hypothetical protein